MSSILLILSMTFDKVYGIIKPHKSASFNTVKRAKITIALIIIFSCLFNIPYLFSVTTSGIYCALDPSTFENNFYFWLTCVVQFVIPFILLLSMNSVIIHTIRVRSRSNMLMTTDQGQGQSQGQDKGQGQGQGQGQNQQAKGSETQVFAILLLVAFGFFVLITPLYTFNVYVSVFDFSKTPQRFAFYYMYYEIVVKLYYTNNAINFFLYVISGTKFRTDLMKLFQCCELNRKEMPVRNSKEINSSVGTIQVIAFFKTKWWTHAIFGLLMPLVWTSGDISSRFQCQGGQPYSQMVSAGAGCKTRTKDLPLGSQRR